jgi:thioredoxin-related protein
MMRKMMYVMLVLMSMTFVACAQSQKDNKNEIKWKTFEEVEVLMKTKPKKVLVDLYTNWCGWCKRMDANTYSNSELIDYVNENYYAIKFNTEEKKDIVFQGKTYKMSQQGRNATNQLAIELLNGKLSYPTTAFLDENFQPIAVQPGYLEVDIMETILKYIGTNSHKKQAYQDFVSANKFTWKK